MRQIWDLSSAAWTALCNAGETSWTAVFNAGASTWGKVSEARLSLIDTTAACLLRLRQQLFPGHAALPLQIDGPILVQTGIKIVILKWKNEVIINGIFFAKIFIKPTVI